MKYLDTFVFPTEIVSLVLTPYNINFLPYSNNHILDPLYEPEWVPPTPGIRILCNRIHMT